MKKMVLILVLGIFLTSLVFAITSYAIEDGQLDSDLTNYEVVAILNNPDLEQDMIEIIVTSDKIMSDPEFLKFYFKQVR